MPRNNQESRSGPRSFDEERWQRTMQELLEMELSGLQIQCPKCGRNGVPSPKWEQGPATKPVYVFHRNGTDKPDMCELDRDEASAFQGNTQLGDEDLGILLSHSAPYVLFSGGKDSLCLLHYLATQAFRIGVQVTALHVNTTAGFPEVTEYVEKTCAALNIPLHVLSPRQDFFTLAKKWGIPSHNSRWCCRELKIRPVMDFLAEVDGPKIVFDGIRWAESWLRAKYLPVWFHPAFSCLCASPILHWSDDDIESYIRQQELPRNPCAELGTSAECWCGAYKTRTDLEQLYLSHPEIFHKLMEVESANRHGFTFVYEDGRRIPLGEVAEGLGSADGIG